MKKILLTITAVAFATFSFSQQLSRYVVASGGNYSSSAGISLSSTVGEPMVNTLTGTGFILTQGFQQSFSAPACPDNDVTITVGGGSWTSEVGWSLVNSSGTVVASGGAPFTGTACLADDCYTMNMTDAYGDGWNGSTYSITDNASGTVYGTGGLASGSAGSDLVSIGAACPVYGCTDPLANNFDPLATIDDGSCIYPVPCNTDAFCDDFESGSFVAGNWLASSGIDADVYVGTTSPITGAYSAEFTGGYYTGWTGGSSSTTSAQAWSNTSHISAIDMCLDLSAVASGGPLNMVLDYNSSTYFGASTGNYSWFRVLVDGVVLADANGNLDHHAPGLLTLQYDLSAHAGLNPTVTLQAACKYDVNYSSGAYADFVFVDNLCIVQAVPGCTDPTATNYNSAATQDDGSCVYPCTDNVVAVNMYDSYGDGWNGNTYSISDASGVVASGGLASGSFGSDTLCLVDGCYDITVGGGSYPSEVSFDFGSLVGAAVGTYTDISIGGAMCGIGGCMDSAATNYDASATYDDGSCTYSCAYYGLDDITINLYDSWGDGWNGNTLTVDGIDYTIAGFASSESFAVCADLSTCITALYNNTGSYASENSWDITDASGAVLISGGNIGSGGDFGNCGTPGCTDAAACNYDAAATIDDGSCSYQDGSSIDLIANSPNDWYADWDNDGIYESYAQGYTYNISFSANGTGMFQGTYCIDSWSLCNDAFTMDYGGSSSCSGTIYTGSVDANGNVVGTSSNGGFLIGTPTLGCTDALATNYDANANADDGLCTYSNTCGLPTNLHVTDLIHDRVTLNWNSTNSATCEVDQIRIKYREVGTNSWSQKNIGAPTGSPPGPSCNISNADKLVLNLNPGTQYEWYMKVWYCNAATAGWTALHNFTTLDACPNVINFAVSTPTTTKATFTWDTSGVYTFVRIRIKVDSVGGGFTTAGGFGINYGILTKDKNGLTPGQAYKGWARTWCDPAGGPYRADVWNGPVLWSQPTSIRLEGGTTIAGLVISPNPSRDVFNISFVSEQKQNLRVRVLNVIGEEIISEDLQEFVGEYVKSISLNKYKRGIYFLEIETDNGIINKKLILQ